MPLSLRLLSLYLNTMSRSGEKRVKEHKDRLCYARLLIAFSGTHFESTKESAAAAGEESERSRRGGFCVGWGLKVFHPTDARG